jgi:hypothetical protein
MVTWQRNVIMGRKTKARQRPPHQTVCWIPRDERDITSVSVRSPSANQKTTRRVPRITLSGQWLRRAGFPPGARILIMVQTPGQLIIDRLR